jgi:hypothetical protein
MSNLFILKLVSVNQINQQEIIIMKNIKAKIERVEKETKRIEVINKLITYYEASHLKPVATFVNGDQVGRIDDAVIIDKSIMVQMLAEQILTIELEIEEDVQFIAAVELLASKGILEVK